jgi:hypothetical protein
MGVDSEASASLVSLGLGDQRPTNSTARSSVHSPTDSCGDYSMITSGDLAQHTHGSVVAALVGISLTVQWYHQAITGRRTSRRGNIERTSVHSLEVSGGPHIVVREGIFNIVHLVAACGQLQPMRTLRMLFALYVVYCTRMLRTICKASRWRRTFKLAESCVFETFKHSAHHAPKRAFWRARRWTTVQSATQRTEAPHRMA